jgi:hypothetical protein
MAGRKDRRIVLTVPEFVCPARSGRRVNAMKIKKNENTGPQPNRTVGGVNKNQAVILANNGISARARVRHLMCNLSFRTKPKANRQPAASTITR